MYVLCICCSERDDRKVIAKYFFRDTSTFSQVLLKSSERYEKNLIREELASESSSIWKFRSSVPHLDRVNLRAVAKTEKELFSFSQVIGAN